MTYFCRRCFAARFFRHATSRFSGSSSETDRTLHDLLVRLTAASRRASAYTPIAGRRRGPRAGAEHARPAHPAVANWLSRCELADGADRLTDRTLSPMRVGDVRLWVFVAIVLALVGLLLYLTVAAGGF